jgi:pimeloyl-ACP methyl ester carboxylesterase
MTRRLIAATVTISIVAGVFAAGCTRKQEPATPAESSPPAGQAVPAHAMASENTVPSLAADGTEIHYKVYGSGQPTLVFVHGWSCDSRYWDAQLDDFAAQYTVVTLDLAGHGSSTTGARKDWSMAGYGTDVASVVEAIGAPRVVLIGHSMGGQVILEAARRLPGKVIGLVGVDTYHDIPGGMPEAEIEEQLKPFRTDFASTTRAFVRDNFFTEKSDALIKQWIIDDMSQAPPEVAVPSLVSLVHMDQRAVVTELDVPIVAINSDKYPTPVDEIRAIEPRFRMVPMTGVGHFVMMEDPATFNALLQQVVSTWARIDSRSLSP